MAELVSLLSNTYVQLGLAGTAVVATIGEMHAIALPPGPARLPFNCRELLVCLAQHVVCLRSIFRGRLWREGAEEGGRQTKKSECSE